jgi:L-malate glycosyltransferase
MKKIKILHVVNALDKGGLEEVVYNLVKNSNDEVFDVSVAFFEGGIVSKRLEDKGFQCFKIDADNKWAKIKGLMNVIKQQQIDIVQTHYCFTGIISAKLSGVKVVETVHNTYLWFSNTKGKLLYSSYLNMVDTIVSVSGAVNQFNMGHFYIKNKSKCQIITNSIDSERIQPTERSKEEIKRDFGIPENAQVISTLSRIDVQKGLEYFIEVAKKLLEEQKNLYFLIPGAGEVEYVKQLEESTEDYPNIRFIGHVSKVNELFKMMDIYVMSSLWEGAPLTLLEAMGYGKAVVVTNAGNTSEVIVDGENGFLLEKKDVDGMCDKIKVILDSDKTRQKIEKNAQKDFELRFSNQIMINKYKDLYRSLLNN